MRIRKITFKGIVGEGTLIPGTLGPGAPGYKERSNLVLWLQMHYGAQSKIQRTWGVTWRDCEFFYVGAKRQVR